MKHGNIFRIILIVEKKEDHFVVDQVIHGEALKTKTDLFGEIVASGSRTNDFLM